MSISGSAYVLELPGHRVAPRAEKRVAEHDVLDVACVGILQHLFVKEEEDRQVDFFAREQFLLLKAEALDLGKVGRNPVRHNVVGRNSDNVVVRRVVRLEECQCGLTREHVNLALLRHKRPWNLVRVARVERDANPLCLAFFVEWIRVGRAQTRFVRVARAVRHRRAAVSRRGAEGAVQGDRRVAQTKHDDKLER